MPWLEAVRFHAKAAFRFLQHATGLSVAVVLTLALGIGANSAMFSVLDAVVLRPLPYPASDDLVLLTQHNGSVFLLLLIACSNIAGLLLASTVHREHEISRRFSLGAPRRTIVLQLLAETFALALLGSLLGFAVAALITHVFHLLAGTLPRAEEISLDGRIVLYSLLCAVGTTLLCGLYSAIRGTRRQLAQSLAGTSRTQTAAHQPTQWVLVDVQVTLAVVLLTGAGLLVRSLQELGRVLPGFDAVHVLTFQVTGSYGETMDMGRLTLRMGRTLDALRALPGVTAAATSSAIPGMPGKYQDDYRRDGQTGTEQSDSDQRLLAESRLVPDGYFTAMGIHA